MKKRLLALAAVGLGVLAGCHHASPPAETSASLSQHKPGTKVERTGDEIVVCGHYFHTGAPVVLWTDPGGYDAYRVERRFVPFDKSDWATTHKEAPDLAPSRFGLRLRQDGHNILTPEQVEMVRGGGWPLELLQDKVDQFVIHYDCCGTSRRCFQVLHDLRGLSVQFMLDVDGTIYQTLDLKERAWHAGTANSRSVGIEIANMGAYPPNDPQSPLPQWYSKDSFGRTTIVVPAAFQPSGIRTPNFVGHPFYNSPIVGKIQGRLYQQYDFTPEQYESLARLTATLCTVFPKLKCDYPKDENGKLIDHVLAPEQLKAYQGVMGHWHVTEEKEDPGPAFQWDLVINHARMLMKGQPG